MRAVIMILGLWCGAAAAQSGDTVFGGAGAGFESAVDLPASDAQAARFLTRATFGPTLADIAQLRAVGYTAWLDQQMSTAPTLQRPPVEATIAQAVLTDTRNGPFYRRFRLENWFKTQLSAPDQLRQKVAYALSQILVVSDATVLDDNPIGVAEYNDILLRNAFGNYRALLGEVTRSPAMGVYLSHLRNRKTDWTYVGNVLTPSQLQPDENYAREIMQLFSIGLIARDLDFSPILVGGVTVPTYTQDTITNTARVFTGLSFGCTGPETIGTITLNRNCGCTGTACNFAPVLFNQNPPRYAANNNVSALIHPDAYRPMVCYPRYADTGRSATGQDNYSILAPPYDRKRIIDGLEIGPSPVACYTNTPAADRQACIDYCDDQVDTVVDALANHPNVAPFIARQLIQRLVTSNPSAPYIRRVAEVFVDDGHSRRGNLDAVVRAVLLDPEAMSDTPAPSFGKLREPMLRLIAVWRAFGAQTGSSGLTGMTEPETPFLQRPLGAPSVFNFYEPDYQPPGALQDAGLYAPELQISNESSVVSTSDSLWSNFSAGYTFVGSNTTSFAVPANSAYLPATVIDALPSAHAALVDALDLRLMAGTMSPGMKTKLVALLDGPMAATDKRRKALDLIHLIAISPEFAVQR